MFKRIYPLIIFFNLITALAWAAPDGVKQNLSVNSTTELAELDTGGGTTWEELEDGDICWVISATGLSVRIYIYDSDSAQTEDGERYVTPDESSTGVPYSGDARWVCMSTAQAGADGDYYAELGNNSSIDPDASKYQVYFDAGELKVNENGTEKYIANLTDAQTFAGAITFGSTVSGSAGSMTVTATGFDGNLETTDDTLQEIAQALDDLTISAGISDGDKGDITVASSGASWTVDAFAHTASPNWIFYDSDNAGADEECARIEANATTTTDGAEDADLIFSVMQGGTVTPVLTFDESDDQWETTKAMTFAGGAITGATTFSGAGEINLPSSDASPDVAGEIRHDSTVTGLTTGALAWYDGDEVRYIVDLDVLPSNDDYVVSYDADNDIFYMKADATGAGGGDSISVDGSAVVDPNFDDGGDINFTDSSNTVTASLKADVVGTDEMADADHGMGSWTSGALTVEDFALNADADAGDYDIQSIDRLEGIDATEFIDMGADGYVVVDAGTAINLDSSVQCGDGTYSWGHTPAFGIEGILEVDGAAYFDGAVTFGSTVSGSAADMTVVATGFDGNLATTDNTLQEIAQKLDDLTAGGSSDPDALDGDTTDDNLIDSAIIAAFVSQAAPNWIFYDSDNAGADEECARIEANATTTTDGSEDGDLIFSVMQGGTVTPFARLDESDDALVIYDSKRIIFDEAANDPNDADIVLSGADGVLTIAAANGANNENLTIDLDSASNTATIGTGTGVTTISTALSITCAGITNTGTATIGDAGDNIQIVYDPTPGTDATVSGDLIQVVTTAGLNAVAGDLVYVANTGGANGPVVALADADAATTCGAVFLITESISAGNAGKALIQGVMRLDSWTWSGANKALYISTTAGDLTETAPSGTGDQVQILGHSLTPDIVLFRPSPVLVELQ